MKCPKCKREFRIGQEQIGVNEQNMPILKTFCYCDYCRIKYDYEATLKTQPKKDSTLSIWAAILAFFTCTCFIGGILGLVDLCMNDKTKRHLGSWFAIVFCCLWIFICFLNLINGNEEDKPQTQNNSQVIIQEETKSELAEISEETLIKVEYTEEEYKALCKEMYYDDVFFGDNLSEGDFVKLHLMVSENYYFTMDSLYSDSFSDLMDKWDLQRDFKKCSVLRENEDSYFGVGKVDLYFSNEYELNPIDYQPGDKIIIYGEIISFYKDEWDGYNDVIIIPKYIEIQ